MATLNGLPVFKIKINESLENREGIEFVSLVDYPAIETNWVALAKTDKKVPLKFSFSEDQKLLFGPALIPDLPIYRYDNKQGEYYVVFTKDEIQKIVRKFQKQNKNLNLNYQHKPDSQIDAVIQEIWLTGKSDKSKDYGFDLPEGSAFVVTYVEDDKFWNEQVKTGNVKGYSIEGWLDMEMKSDKKYTVGNIQKYDVVKRAQNNDLFISGEIKVGNYVYYNQPQIVLIGEQQQELRTPVWENDIELADGRVLLLENGKIIQILDKQQALNHKRKKDKMSNQKFIEAKTTEGMMLKTDSEMWTVGSNAMVVDAEGKETPAEGDYTLENGTVIKCMGGKVTEIVESDAQLTEEEQAAMSKLFASIIKPLQDKIDALEVKLANLPGAPAKTGGNDTNGTPKKSAAQMAYEKVKKLKDLNIK